MRWECPNCGQAVSLGLDTCPNCQTGVPPEKRQKVVLPPAKGSDIPELVPPQEAGFRAFIAQGYHLFVGVLLGFLVIYLLWLILS